MIYCIVLHCRLTSRRIEEHFPQLRAVGAPGYHLWTEARWRPLCVACRAKRHEAIEDGRVLFIDFGGECRCQLGGLDELLKCGKKVLCPACRLAYLARLHTAVTKVLNIENSGYSPACCLCHETSGLTSTTICGGCKQLGGVSRHVTPASSV